MEEEPVRRWAAPPEPATSNLPSQRKRCPKPEPAACLACWQAEAPALVWLVIPSRPVSVWLRPAVAVRQWVPVQTALLLLEPAQAPVRAQLPALRPGFPGL